MTIHTSCLSHEQRMKFLDCRFIACNIPRFRMIPWTATETFIRTVGKFPFLVSAPRPRSNIYINLCQHGRLGDNIRQRIRRRQRPRHRKRQSRSKLRRRNAEHERCSRFHFPRVTFCTIIRLRFFAGRRCSIVARFGMTPQSAKCRGVRDRFLSRFSVPWLLCRLVLVLCASGDGGRGCWCARGCCHCGG
jgi:hypothetical protein